MSRFVLGFCMVGFSHVALVKKARPARQAGRYNGIGGRVEAGEDPEDAMVREFREETGLEVNTWGHRVTISGTDREVLVYVSWLVRTERLRNPDASEPVGWFDQFRLPSPCLHSLHWLIPLCRDPDVAAPVVVRDRTGVSC
jgi:8-oxo-dGTP diphosphatase